MDEPPHKNPVPRCQECYIPQSECWIRHYFLLNLYIRRFCTNCVLKNSLDGFCPVCFEVYEDSTAPPPCPDRVICSKCPSISHRSCISSGFDSAYLCPLCSDPNLAFFSLGRSEAGRIVDLKSSKVFLAAATLAARSMRKAMAGAKAVADKEIEMAAIARKEAIRALERFAFIDQPEKVRKESANRNSNKDDDDSKANSDTNIDADSKADSSGDAAFAEELTEMLEFDSKADTNRDDDSKANSDTNVDADSNADSKNGGDAEFAEELAEMLDSDSNDDN